MSQSHKPTDSQGLLQSMLLRLKLQPGKEDQSFLHTPLPATDSQKANSHIGSNGDPAEGDRILNGGVDKGPVSFPSRKDNSDKVDGSGLLGEVTSPEICPTGTGKSFPAQSPKGPDMTDGEIVTFGDSAMTRHINGDKGAVTTSGNSQMPDEGFRPKVYLWSLKPAENVTPGSQDSKTTHVGFGDLGASEDWQFDASSQMTPNSGSRRKQRSSETKTRRWTQRIKERWMDRSGSFGKKGPEGAGRVERKSAPGGEPQATESHTNTTKSKEYTSDPSVSPSMHTEEGPPEERIRSSSDFEFGLGSFSLLEEIVTGQEWAKFLNPNQPATSANRRPSEERHRQLISPSNLYDNGQPPFPDSAAPQVSADAFLPVSMDVSEEKPQDAHALADHAEPMEDWQSGEKGQGLDHAPTSVVEVAHILANSRLNRIHRKRQHRTAEGHETLHTLGTASMSQEHAMEETGGSRHDIADASNGPPAPLSPCFKPFHTAPRGVLKQSVSSESEFSMETVKKRRRLEDNRRVHFSDAVVTIDPPEMGADATDSEEDSGADDDSAIEQEHAADQAAMEEAPVAVAARRPALPAWIQALKRNKGRKRR